MYGNGLAFDWRNALSGGIAAVEPTPGPAAPSTTPSWWEAPLGQAAQAGADWVTSELTEVPTYGGSPAYPAGTPGYQFYNVPDAPLGTIPEPMQAGMAGGGVTALLLVGGGLLAAKMLGVF